MTLRPLHFADGLVVEDEPFDRTCHGAAGEDEDEADDGVDRNRFAEDDGRQDEGDDGLQEEGEGRIRRARELDGLHEAEVAEAGDDEGAVNERPDRVAVDAADDGVTVDEQDDQEERAADEEAEGVFDIAAELGDAQFPQRRIEGEGNGSSQGDTEAEVAAFDDVDRVGDDDQADDAEDQGDRLFPRECFMDDKV